MCFSSLNVCLLRSLHIVHIKLKGTIFHMSNECLPPIFSNQTINQLPSLLNPMHPKRSENKTPQVIAHLATNFSLQISSSLKRNFLFTSKEEFWIISSLIPFLSLPLSLGKHNFNQRGKKTTKQQQQQIKFFLQVNKKIGLLTQPSQTTCIGLSWALQFCFSVP